MLCYEDSHITHYKTESLKLVSFACFHSIMSCGIIFWGYLTEVFCVQKKIITIMTGIKRTVSCRELFKNYSIFSLASKFLLYYYLLWTTLKNFKQIQIYTIYVQDTNITSMLWPITSVSIRKKFTVLELGYSVIFLLQWNVWITVYNCLSQQQKSTSYLTPSTM
jgi:hypothetical protein